MKIPLNFKGEASLPSFLRWWIVKFYPAWVIERIDRAGRFHDWLTYKYPNTTTHNRKRFVKLLCRLGIPRKLIIVIHGGLAAYDYSPGWLQKQLKKTTKEHVID